MMHAASRWMLLSLLPVGMLSCGAPAGSTTPQSAVGSAVPVVAPGAPGSATADADGAKDGRGRKAGPPTTAAPVATTGAPPPTAGGDYEITYGDCADLVATFEKRLREEEMAKLEAQKLKGKAQEQGLATVDEVVRTGVENWRGQCQTIVGTVQVRSRIRCAIAADSRARFDGCWDGQFDGE
jgi:hypothetical protein